jgi:hypothetical protein
LADLAKAGVVSSTVSVNAPAPGVTSASTLPQGARQAVGATAPRLQVVAPMAPPMPPASIAPAMQPSAGYAQAPMYAQAQAAQKSSKGPLIGIAAAAVLALGGGAFATRSHWLPSSSEGGSSPIAQEQPVEPISKSVEPTTPSNPPVASTEVKVVDAPSTAQDPAIAINVPGVSINTGNAAEADPVKSLEVAVSTQGVAIEAQDNEIARLKAENAKLAAAQTGTTDVREPLAGVRERVQAANKRDLAPTSASNTPARTAIPNVKPARTGVVVLAIGEMAAAGAAESMIEDALRDGGYTVIDEDAFPGLANLRGRGTAAGILVAARNAGISALVVVNAKRTGSRQLDFYGQSETQLMSTLEVKAFGTVNGASLNSFSEQIEYVSPRAGETARTAVESHLNQLVTRLSAHRGRG